MESRTPRQHCTQHPIISPSESEYLISILAEDLMEAHFGVDPRRINNWDDATAIFNANFGAPERTTRLLRCALRRQRDAFKAALVARYRAGKKAREALKAKPSASGDV